MAIRISRGTSGTIRSPGLQLTGEYLWIIVGALVLGAISNVGIQLYENGGDFSKLNGWRVAQAGLLGGTLSAFGPSVAESSLFARSGSFLNVNNNALFRVGWGWRGTKFVGEEDGTSGSAASTGWQRALSCGSEFVES